MNARKYKKKHLFFEKTLTFEFQSIKYMAFKSFVVQKQFIIDAFTLKLAQPTGLSQHTTFLYQEVEKKLENDASKLCIEDFFCA